MNNYDYKTDIVNSRVGGIGGSESTMLATIANLGYVPKTAYKRMAICKGLIPIENHGTNAAMRAGDYIENAIFNHLAAGDNSYISNPLWVSERYSKQNVKFLCHPDIVRFDEKKQTLYVYECKTTRYDVQHTKNTYKTQLFTEWLLAKEQAMKKGKRWRVKLYLVHYSTLGLDLEDGIEFDPERMSVNEVRFRSNVFDVDKAMTIVNDFLNTFNEYYEGDEIQYKLLPANVQAQFDNITTLLAEIKEKETKVADFKKKLTEFMVCKGVRGIKTDAWAITLVNESESVSVDYKAIFANEIEAKKPRVANKLKKQYKKVTKKAAYVMFKLKDNNNN